VNRLSFERRGASFCGMLGGVGRAGHNRASSGPMTQRDRALFKTGWISLAIIGVAILLFGLITTAVPASSEAPYMRAIGVASIGMGLFGLLITTIAYRRRERWAWFALWYYPLDGAPGRRIAARKRSRPPGRVYHTLACGPAAARTRVLRAKGSTGTHDDLLKVPRVPTAANFLELRKAEVQLRRISLPRRPVNRA